MATFGYNFCFDCATKHIDDQVLFNILSGMSKEHLEAVLWQCTRFYSDLPSFIECINNLNECGAQDIVLEILNEEEESIEDIAAARQKKSRIATLRGDSDEPIDTTSLSGVLEEVGSSRVLSFLDERTLLKFADALDDTQGSLANCISEEFASRGVDPANVVRSALYLLYGKSVPHHFMRQWTDDTEIVLKFVGRILRDIQGAISLDECEGSNHHKERFLSQLLLLESCGILSVDQRNDGDVLIDAGRRFLEIDYEDEDDEMVSPF